MQKTLRRGTLPLRAFGEIVVLAGAVTCGPVMTATPFNSPAIAQEASRKEATRERLPVKRVVVYDTGVGFIEHEAAISGSTELLMELPDHDVNDLLKSLVVKDLGGGRISWAALPTGRSKKSPITIDGRKDLAEILTALRGMRVRIGDAAAIEGTLLLVENRTIELTKEIIPQLTLLTTSGVVRVDLKNGDTVQVVDDAQRRAVALSSELLNTSFTDSTTRVRLHCEGEGRRHVRFGYVAAMPIWKASYRLVLREDGKSLLQAWALVENDTQSDWSEVDCTLVSGRSLGFETDLRTPLHIKRPYRAPERFAAIAPETHKDAEAPQLARQSPSEEAIEADSLDLAPVKSGMGGIGMGGMGGMGGMLDPSQARPTDTTSEMSDLLNRQLQRWRSQSARTASSIASTPQGGVADAASGIGESIRYELKGAVSIAKGETALLHLQDAELSGREIALFNPSIHPSHPLRAIQMDNSTSAALAAGPVSIFSGDSYRGDALINFWPAGAKRLISYAIDTEASVRWVSEETPLEQLGVFVTEEDEVVFLAKESLKGSYILENRGAAAKRVWVEHPRFKDWDLSEPKGVAETAPDRYRIEQVIEPQKEASIPVSLTRYRLLWPQEISWRLSEREQKSLPFMTESVQTLLQLQKDYDAYFEKLHNRSYEIEEEIDELSGDQSRVRDTIESLAKFPEQGKVFIDRLLALELKLDELRKESKELEALLEDEDAQAETDYVKAHNERRLKLLPQIKAEHPLEKLPYQPTEKEMKSWRERIQYHSPSLQGLGGMGGMGGGGFF